MIVNWDALNAKLEAEGVSGFGTLVAQAAMKAVFGIDALSHVPDLEALLGQDGILSAVEACIEDCPSPDSARSILQYYRPFVAMERCYEIYHTDSDLEIRRSAVSLLRYIGDASVLPWIKEFLIDPDIGIQATGADIFELLLWSGEVCKSPELLSTVNTIFKIADSNPNGGGKQSMDLAHQHLQQNPFSFRRA